MLHITKLSSRLLKRFTLINIYGKSGTGKTTYALQLLSDFLVADKISEYSAPSPDNTMFVWVQGNDKFPKTRLNEMYEGNTKLLRYLQSHILLYPRFPMRTYDEFCEQLLNLSRNSQALPFTPRAIIIDNISHHLRLEISQYEDLTLITALMDDFFDTVIVPLTFYCGRHNVSLVLIHEVSYNPKKDKTVMFNHNLYSNLEALNIKLEKEPIARRQTISFSFQNFSKTYRYRLKRKGIQLIS